MPLHTSANFANMNAINNQSKRACFLINVQATVVALAVILAAAPARVEAADTSAAKSPPLYDETADGSKQVADALVVAKKDGKHVLLQFGANWCGWCHRLHTLFDTDKGIGEELKNNYVVVLIDVNKGHNQTTDSKYDHPTRFGLPAIVVLDADGKQLTTKNSGELEEGDHHSPEKVMAFLKEWAPKK